MTGEAAAFRALKEAPSPDTLVELLRAHQERIFRLCYQVLHNAADAEDAAQEALLKIPGELRRFSDPDSFRRWLYRVSLNAALEGARKAARRHAHETRAAMEKSAPRPLDAATRLALFEALAALDERPRNLVLEHYFEGESLESIGKREGFSAPAACKKLDEACESLRRRLGGAGAMAALPNLEALFPATPAAPDLVTGAVLAKIAAIAGGAAMTSKAMILPVAVAVALLLSLGVGIVAMDIRLPDSAGPGNSLSRAATNVDASADTPVAQDLPKVGLAAEEKEPGAEADPVRLSPLRARLDRFKKWWAAKESTGFGEDPGRNKHDKELWEHVSGLRGLILADPDGFLAFLKDPANEAMLMDLTQMNPLVQTDRPYVSHLTPFDEYPARLKDGLLDLLLTGTSRQRVATLRLMDGFLEVPEAFKNTYLASIDDAHPQVQAFAIRATGLTVPITPALHSKLAALGTGSESAAVRQAVVGVMSMQPGPAAETYLLNRVETATDSGELYSAIFSLERRYANRGGDSIQEEALARTVSVLVARYQDVRWSRLLHAASHLSGDRLKPILSQIMAKTADLEYRGRLQRAIEMIDKGDTRRDELMKVLEPPP